MRGNRWGRRMLAYSESYLSENGLLYTFAFLYVVINLLMFLREAFEESTYHTNYRRYVTAISRGSGAIINLNAALVLLLASRTLLRLLRGTLLSTVLPFDRAMPDMHRLVGIIMLLAASVHTVSHIVVYILSSVWSPGFDGFTSLFVTGLLLFCVLVTIRFVALSSLLRSSYEQFYRIHVGCSVLFYVLIIIHGLHRGVPNSWRYVIGPLVIYIGDVAYRYMQEQKVHLLLFKHSAACQGENIVKIRVPRTFHYKAGQYAEIKVPAISKLQWHPFTIASAPHEPEIVFYIKAVGDWTSELYNLFQNRTVFDNPDEAIDIVVRGPYGAPAQHVGQFDRVILIGGGVGATPFCSVVKDCSHWITHWLPGRNRRGQGRGRDAVDPAKGHDKKRGDGHDSKDRTVSVSTRQIMPSPNTADTPDLSSYSEAAAVSNEEDASWHFMTTNVRSEDITQSEIVISMDNEEERPAANAENISNSLVVMNRDVTLDRRVVRINEALTEAGGVRGSTSSSGNGTIMYTALDHRPGVSSGSGNDGSGSKSSAPSDIISDQARRDTIQYVSEHDIENGDPVNAITRVETNHSIIHDDVGGERRQQRRTSSRYKKKKILRRNSLAEDDDFTLNRRDDEDERVERGTYYGNSSGSHRHSMDYITAMHTVAFDEQVDEIFRKSIDMMVGISFGSVSLMKSIQTRTIQRSIRDGRVDRASSASMNMDLFQNPRIMFILYMRSVTVNMVILWLLILRMSIAGAAFSVGEFRIFTEGIHLYDYNGLNVIDLVVCTLLFILFLVPSLVETIEFKAAPLHALDLFVLAPIALFGMIVDVLAIRDVATSVDGVFTVFHVLLIWPILMILVVIQLLRIIGERVTQVASTKRPYTSTRAVDFIWTAPFKEDDMWLVEELLSYSAIKEVSLHRYLTKEKKLEDVQVESGGVLRTNLGRPNWTEILNRVAERSKNNSTIGVFFCGPSSMARDAQEASMEAMRNSIVRGLQGGVTASMRGLEEIFGEAVSANEYTGDVHLDRSKASADDKPGRGCNITIVFKKESFS